MKREIKFRGKRVDNGEWVYGSLMQFNGVTCIMPMQVQDSPSDLISFEVHHETVGQYTGLKDKNGNDIYEGDLIFWKDRSNNPEHWRTAEVFYQPLNCCYHARIVKCGTLDDGYVFGNNFGQWEKYNDLKVIGNIHDNENLL